MAINALESVIRNKCRKWFVVRTVKVFIAISIYHTAINRCGML
jgi:hypothetical protein